MAPGKIPSRLPSQLSAAGCPRKEVVVSSTRYSAESAHHDTPPDGENTVWGLLADRAVWIVLFRSLRTVHLRLLTATTIWFFFVFFVWVFVFVVQAMAVTASVCLAACW